MQILPAVSVIRGYKEGVGNYLGPVGQSEHRRATIRGRPVFECEIDLFDVERDRFPYGDNYFDTLLACELLEHLNHDPMHMLIEAHRVLKPNGALVLTTPNAASWTSLHSILTDRENPYLFSHYPNPLKSQTEPGLRHVREFTANEVVRIMTSAGFEVDTLITEDIGDRSIRKWVEPALLHLGMPTVNRGEQIYCLARKLPGADQERLPTFLYHLD
jgi:predicted SAM-dependent methyltransferase